MAKLWITELAYMPGMSQVAQLPPIAEQVVTFTTTTQSAAANHSTRLSINWLKTKISYPHSTKCMPTD